MSVEQTEKKGTQRPWVLLIEKASANGSGRQLETTAFSTDQGIRDFLGREERKTARDIEKLERRLLTITRRKPSGRYRGSSEVSQNRKGLEEDIDTTRANLLVLQGVGRQPIKIKMVGREFVGWERPHGGEDAWVHYVSEAHPEILTFSTKERSLLQRIFMNKYALTEGRKGAIDEYEELLYELRDKDPEGEFTPYIKEISQRLSRR